ASGRARRTRRSTLTVTAAIAEVQHAPLAKALPRRFRLHDTRHTTATLLLAAGVEVYAVARILRHSDPKITFETYAHLVPGYLHDGQLSDSRHRRSARSRPENGLQAQALAAHCR